MKTNFTSVRSFAVILTTVALFSVSVHAQTFTGRHELDHEPSSLRTLIKPAPNSSILRVSYENDGYGTVRLLLSDQKGTVLYDEQQIKPKYSGQLDLAALPNGVYTLVLQTPNARHTEYVHIYTPTSGQIVLKTSRPGSGAVAERISLKQ